MKARRPRSPGLISDDVDERFTLTVAPLIRRLILSRVSPDAITIAAFTLTLAAAVLVGTGRLLLGCALLVIGGVLDFADGKVAVLTGRASVAGAILDSALDRYSDAALFLGLMVYFAAGGYAATALAAAFALVGSGVTSYLMALAESYGYDLRAGLLRRQDRVALLAIGLLLSPLDYWLGPAAAGLVGESLANLPNLPLAAVVWTLAFLANVTAFQRLSAMRRIARGAKLAPAGETLRARQLRKLRDRLESPASRDPEGGESHED